MRAERARVRLIDPGFFINEDLGKLSAITRQLFQGLICQADREGRLEDRPNRIKVLAIPYDDVDIEEELGKLERSGFILRYDTGEYKVIQVVNFLKYQHPPPWEPQSIYLPYG